MTRKRRLIKLSSILVAGVLIGGNGLVPAFSQQPAACDTPVVPDDPGAIDLAALRDHQDVEGMRRNAWTLFTGQLLASDGPKWQDWCAMTNEAGRTLLCPASEELLDVKLLTEKTPQFAEQFNLHKALSAHRNQRFVQSLALPRQLVENANTSTFEEVLGAKGASSNLLMTSSVLFNASSKDTILKCFHDRSSESGGDTSPTSNPWGSTYHLKPPDSACLKDYQFPKDSIAVKTVWAVTANSGNYSQDGTVNLSFSIPLWEEGITSLGTGPIPQAGQRGQWTTMARIGLFTNNDPNQPPDCPDHTFYYTEAGDGHAASDYIPIGCFYWIKIQEKDWEAYAAGTGLRTIATREDHGGSDWIYFILLGFHVTTKELPNWTWQTFWWSGAKSDPESPFQKPTGSSGAIHNGQWSHYRVDATFGPPTNSPATKLQPTYNPYLESLLPNGVNSNCFTCHNNALFHKENPSCALDAGEMMALGQPSGRVDCSAQVRQQFCQTGYRTDFLWSLADINVPPPSSAGSPADFDFSEVLRIENFLKVIQSKPIQQPASNRLVPKAQKLKTPPQTQK